MFQKADLHEDIFDHIATDAGEPRVEPLELYRKRLMIDPEQVQHSGLKVVDADRILFGRIAELIGRPEATRPRDLVEAEDEVQGLRFDWANRPIDGALIDAVEVPRVRL